MTLPRRATAPEHATFFFDFGDPYAFLAARRVPRLLESRGMTLSLAPIDGGRLGAREGSGAQGLTAGVRGYVLDDVARIATRLGLPFRPPATFPFDAVRLLGLCLFVRERSGQEAMAAVADALWHEIWELGSDPADDETLLRAAGDVAIPEATLRAALGDAGLDERVARETARARERGVAAVPAVALESRLLSGFEAVASLDPDLARAAGLVAEAPRDAGGAGGTPPRDDMPDWTFTG
ncbi:MAG: 2-hydroxychromene-2-carboxylate isomerase [Acidobacteriota bacterium]